MKRGKLGGEGRIRGEVVEGEERIDLRSGLDGDITNDVML